MHAGFYDSEVLFLAVLQKFEYMGDKKLLLLKW